MNQKKPSHIQSRYRRSYQLGPSWVLFLSIGMWLVLGVFGLFDSIALQVGVSTGWVYIIALVLAVPSILSQLELRSWLGHHGTSYRLLQRLERPNITFFAGWTYLLGWAAVSAFVAQVFSLYASNVFDFLYATGWIDFNLNSLSWWSTGLPIILVLFFVILNTLGYRPEWRLGAGIISTTIIVVILLILSVVIKPVDLPKILVLTPRNPRFFEAVSLLMTAGWSWEILSEARSRKQKTRLIMVGQISGSLLGGALGLISLWATQALYLLSAPLLEQPSLVSLLLAVFAMAVTAITWQMLALLMLRQFQYIGRDGILPKWLMERSTPFKTPGLLILFQGILTILALFIGNMIHVAALAALAYLVLQAGINIAAITLVKHAQAKDRSIVLPLYPVIQASGAAISFLLILVLPLWPAVIIGLIWYGIGVMIYWQFGRANMRDTQLGRTVFQDTTRRRNVTSDFPVLVPVANPDTAMNLLAFGAAIARRYQGHLVILQVIQVPEHVPLDVGRWQAQQKLNLLDQVLEKAESYNVPVEGITRASRSITQGILDTLTEESVRLCVMGWNARPQKESRRGLGHIIDELLDNAPCDVVIIHGNWDDELHDVLVPASTGPHAPRAAELALALAAEQGTVSLINVTRPENGDESIQQGQHILSEIREALSSPERIQTEVVTADSPLEGIVLAAHEKDAIFLGISEERVLTDQQAGPQLPLELVRSVDLPVAFIFNYVGLTNLVARKAWQSIADIFPTLSYNDQMAVYRSMRQAARPNINYFVLIILSALIATLGLMLNSPAVIIGAMLVAPLMSPIVATAMAIVYGNGRMLRDALTSTVQGVVAAIFIAVLATIMTPLSEPTSEILSRTSPNLLDLMVALFSGMAGAYAIGRKEVGAALPGVAIAAALMPPVCAIGVGIAYGDPVITFGALLLFVANLVAIIFSAVIVFLMLGMRPFSNSPDRQRSLRQGLIISVVSLLVISIPLGYILFQTTQRGQIESQVRTKINDVSKEWGQVDLVEFNINYRWQEVTVAGTLLTTQPITEADRQYLEEQIQSVVRPDVHVELFVIEGNLLKEEP